MCGAVVDGQPWEIVRAGLLRRAQQLEFEAAAAREAGEVDVAHLLAGERDAHRHLADALAEVRDVGWLLDGLPGLLRLARDQARYCQEQVRRWEGRGERGRHSVVVYRGLLIYWRSVGESYRAIADRLRSGQAVQEPGREVGDDGAR